MPPSSSTRGRTTPRPRSRSAAPASPSNRPIPPRSGSSGRRAAFRFDVSAYHTEFQNFIYKRFTGQKCDSDFASCGTGSELDQIVYSQQDATFYGAELLSELDIARIWRGVWGIDGQYDFVHAVFADGTYVPKMPPHRLGGGIYYRDINWLARVNLLHAFAQDEFATFDTPTPGYNLLNAELSYTTKLDRQASLVPRDHGRHQGRKPPQR